MVNSVEILNRKENMSWTYPFSPARYVSILRVRRLAPALLSWYARPHNFTICRRPLFGASGLRLASRRPLLVAPVCARAKDARALRYTDQKNHRNGLLKRINSEVELWRCQGKNARRSVGLSQNQFSDLSPRFSVDQRRRRVDSRTANSGAILRCTAESLALLEHGVDAIKRNAGGDGAHEFHGLADGGERWSVKGGGGDVVKANDGTIFGNAQSGFGQGADGAESGHVIESHEGGKGTLLLEQAFGQFVAVLETGDGIAGFGKIEDQAGIDFEIVGLGKGTNSLPARGAVGQGFGAANEGDLAMSQGVEMLDGGMGAEFVVHHDGADGIGFAVRARS